MSKRSNIFTEAVLEVAGRLKQYKDEAAKAKPVPFMQQAVSPNDIRKRWGVMSERDRASLVEKHGVERVLSALRGK